MDILHRSGRALVPEMYGHSGMAFAMEKTGRVVTGGGGGCGWIQWGKPEIDKGQDKG